MEWEYRIKKVTNGGGHETFYIQRRYNKKTFLPEDLVEFVLFLAFPIYIMVYIAMRSWTAETKQHHFRNISEEVYFDTLHQSERYIREKMLKDEKELIDEQNKKNALKIKKKKKTEYIKYP